MSILLPSGPQYGVPYVLVGPDGERCVFNDESDPDYVGMLTDLSGLDSPDVRESADDLVGMDGGVHGDFFYSRRPITLEGQIMHGGDTVLRNMQMAKLQRATSALRGDATLTWTPDGGVEQYLSVRRQQPLRITGGWNKTFQASMVAADPRIYSSELHLQEVNASDTTGITGFTFPLSFDINFGTGPIAGQVTPVNRGNTEAFPVYYVTGIGTNPTISNLTTGTYLRMVYTLPSDQVMVIDTLNRTIKLAFRVSNPGTAPKDSPTPVSRYSTLDFFDSNWSGLAPGANDIRVSFDSLGAGAQLGVTWRDAWL